jgi:hypothetical protein
MVKPNVHLLKSPLMRQIVSAFTHLQREPTPKGDSADPSPVTPCLSVTIRTPPLTTSICVSQPGYLDAYTFRPWQLIEPRGKEEASPTNAGGKYAVKLYYMVCIERNGGRFLSTPKRL